ncbi:hypothetical protein RB594_006121 [Gaeumannomyces avenae]
MPSASFSGPGSTTASAPRSYDLRPFDVSSVLILRDQHKNPKVARRRSVRNVSGDVEELLSMFDACLRIGKLERASIMLARITSDFPIIARSDIMDLHNDYLHRAIELLMESPSMTKADAIHDWYELNLRAVEPALKQTPETIAYMLKACLLSSPTRDGRLNRLVSRYMAMAPGTVGLEVLYMTDILTDTDRARITEICPTYNLAIAESAKPVEERETASAEDLAASVEAPISSMTSPGPSSYPEVLSTPQKGSGLKTLKQTLSLFREIPAGIDIDTLTQPQRREIQARLERDAVDAAIERWRDDNQALQKMGLSTSISSASLNSRLYDWQRALEARLKLEFTEFDALDKAGLGEKVRGENAERAVYGPFLQLSTPSRLAALTILAVLSGVSGNGVDVGVPLYSLVKILGSAAEEDVRTQRRDEAEAKKRKAFTKAAKLKASQSKAEPKEELQGEPQQELRGEPQQELQPQQQPQQRGREQPEPEYMARPDISPELQDGDWNESVGEPTARVEALYSQDPSAERWPVGIKYQVGAALLQAIIQTATITVVKEHPETGSLVSESQPAFVHNQQYKRGKKVGVLVVNKTLVEMLKREPRADFLARHLPMVCEPEPWTRFDRGGFIESPAQMVRVKPGERDQKIYAEAAIENGHMEQIMKGLDSLGKTAWKINKNVFGVMLDVWNSGEALANIPPLDPKIPVPEEPVATEDPVARRKWLNAVKMAENLKSSLHGVRCFMNFQLEIARAVRDQTIYFPHNVDFRGRAYPLPTYFNHMGADHVRGLMLFAKGKELGEEGFRWLKVHLANVFGFDKASLREREKFAMENLENIMDSATNPLTGRRWWLRGEDPWQCLATCYELKAAFESPDATKFISHLPVHQDGTCNGLQHYAALGGDEWGARQVNLEPGERPADVYSAVADLVSEDLARDAEAGNFMAKALNGKIKRKVVKQTVMTNVYGVTFAGAKKQVQKQLDALYPDLAEQAGVEPVVLSSYIAMKIFSALSQMFSGAHEIQTWLGEIGGRVCRAITPEQLKQLAAQFPEEQLMTGDGRSKTKAAKGVKTAKGDKAAKGDATAKGKKKKAPTTDDLLSHFRSTIVWTTPLRMPVVQPYRHTGVRLISTCLQTLALKTPEASDPVNRRKQLQAFPPNFIHSLDASHMMLSALECGEMGLTFAAVHDSFWTHATDVGRMSRVLRDAFVRIHTEDVIARLAAEFETRYAGSIYMAKIKFGSPGTPRIWSWRKKTGFSLVEELMLEKKRQELLRSEDPAEVAKGLAMETPSSILEAETAVEEVTEKEDVEQFSLGKVPEAEHAQMEKDMLKAQKDSEKASVADPENDVGDSTEEGPTEGTHVEAGGDTAEDGMGRIQALLGTSGFDVAMHPQNFPEKKRSDSAKETILWMPLTFPPLPKKVQILPALQKDWRQSSAANVDRLLGKL